MLSLNLKNKSICRDELLPFSFTFSGSLFMQPIRDDFVFTHLCLMSLSFFVISFLWHSPFRWPYQFRRRLLFGHIIVKIVLDWSRMLLLTNWITEWLLWPQVRARLSLPVSFFHSLHPVTFCYICGTYIHIHMCMDILYKCFVHLLVCLCPYRFSVIATRTSS